MCKHSGKIYTLPTTRVKEFKDASENEATPQEMGIAARLNVQTVPKAFLDSREDQVLVQWHSLPGEETDSETWEPAKHLAEDMKATYRRWEAQGIPKN